MLNYQFYISSDIEGNQKPFIMFGHNKNFEHLGNLAQGHMSRSSGVKKELEGIEEVINNKKEVHHFSGDDWCIVSFKRGRSIISNGFDSFEPFEMDSALIINLMQSWYKFLLAWENGEIPGIIHPDRRSLG